MSPSHQSDDANTVRLLRERGELSQIVQRYGSIDTNGGDAWDDLSLVLELARTYSLLGRESQVEQYFLRCVELHPRRAALYHCQVGWHFQRKKRWARALDWYGKALDTFPGYHLCLFRKGYCLERLHRPSAAAEALLAADTAYTGSPLEQQERSRGIQIQVLFHLARNLRETGKPGDARDALDRSRELDSRPDEPVIRSEHRLASYGEIYLREGNFAAAIQNLEEARDLDGQSSVICERLAGAYERSGRLEEAEATLRRAVELPKGEVALVALGAFLRRADRLAEAAKAFTLALEKHPRGEIQIRIEIAELQRMLARPQTALGELERLAGGRVPPGSTLARVVETRIAEILVEYQHHSRALPYLRAAIEQEPSDPAELARLQELLEKAQAPSPEGARPLEDRELSDEIAQAFGGERLRLDGRVKSYFADRGFGFITHGEGGETIFFHVSHCDLPPGKTPAPGEEVSFVIGVNQRSSRSQAEDVRVRGADS